MADEKKKYLDSEGVTYLWTKMLKKVDDKIQGGAGEITYTNANPVTQAHGGIAKGETFDKVSISKMFDKILYPYVAFSASSFTVGPTNGGLYEYGTSHTISTASVTVTKGSVDITSVKITNGGATVVEKTGDDVKNGGKISFTFDPITVASGVNTVLKCVVTDGTSNKELSSASYSYVYPFYFGVVDHEASAVTAEEILGGTKVVKAKGKQSHSYTTNDSMGFIAYPKSYGTLAKVADGLDVTDYTNSFGSPATVSVTSTDPAWGPVDYYVYCSGRATLDGFTYNFSF